MNVALDRQEAVNRMNRRSQKSVSWTLADMTVNWSYIMANQVRNWDGSFAGDGQDTDRLVLQQMVQRNGQPPRFTNYW